MTEKKEPLKVFIVGERTTDPETWGYGHRAIVIAHDPAEAVALCGDLVSGPCVELDLVNETPKRLMYEAEHGEL